MARGRTSLSLFLVAIFLLVGCGASVNSSVNTPGGSTGGSSGGTSGGSSTGGSNSSTPQVSVSGANSVRVGSTVQFTALVNGATSSAVTWSVNEISGGNSSVGTISSSGLYTPPSALPNPNTVSIKATTVASPSASATLTESILNPMADLTASQPSELLAGADVTVTLSGDGFVSGSTVLANNTPLSTTYKSPSQITAVVSSALLSSNSVSFSIRNPDPGGATGNIISVPVITMPADTAMITLTPGNAISQNFLGASYEWGDGSWYMGWPAVKVNTIYRQLLKNLMDGHDAPFLIRVGGGSTDASSWPTNDTAVAFTAYSSLATDMNVHFTFGVNLAAGDIDMATAQAQFYVSHMPANTVEAIEIGNEPDDYIYNGRRPRSYVINGFLQQYGQWRESILSTLPNSTHLMGPSWGEVKTLTQYLSTFETQESTNTSIITHHLYGAKQDNGEKYASDFLLTPAASTYGATSVANSVKVAHSKGQQFRIGEINSIDVGGVPGISNAFGSALWAVDNMFEYAKVGVDGVNWHGMSGCTYCALTMKVVNDGPHGNIFSLTQVNPLYYGMLFFQKATGNHAKFLPVRVQTNSNIKVWATIDQSNTVYIAILNKDVSFGGHFAVTLPGYGDAQVIRMTAPSYQSTTGITFGGQTFDGSKDGKLVGAASNETVSVQNGIYDLNLQPTSAVLLVLKK